MEWIRHYYLKDGEVWEAMYVVEEVIKKTKYRSSDLPTFQRISRKIPGSEHLCQDPEIWAMFRRAKDEERAEEGTTLSETREDADPDYEV